MIKFKSIQTFHYFSKNLFQVMVYDIIDNENNLDENIFEELELLDQQLLVLNKY